jgi:hypothetical protein
LLSEQFFCHGIQLGTDILRHPVPVDVCRKRGSRRTRRRWGQSPGRSVRDSSTLQLSLVLTVWSAKVTLVPVRDVCNVHTCTPGLSLSHVYCKRDSASLYCYTLCCMMYNILMDTTYILYIIQHFQIILNPVSFKHFILHETHIFGLSYEYHL